MSFQARCVLCLISIVIWTIEAKVFKRCELARELYNIHDIPMDQLATWVCIAYHESRYDTAARNPGSGDHGIFQISEHYWCSASGDDILACGLPCSAFEDDDIEDDVVCARRAYRQHQRLSGNGFNAWSVYRYFCTDPVKVSKYIAGCFEKKEDLTQDVTIKTSNGTRIPKLRFFINIKYTKHFEHGIATTPKPTSTSANNIFPSFIPVIVPGGCYSCNAPITNTNTTSQNNSHHTHHTHHHHHHHYHHVHIHNESSTFRPNTSVSSPFSNNNTLTSPSSQQFSNATTSYRPPSVTTQQTLSSTASSSPSSTIIMVNPQNPTTVSTNRPSSILSTVFTTSATPIVSLPSRPSTVSVSTVPTFESTVSLNGTHHLGKPQLYQHHNHHLHHHTTKRPLHLKPKNELNGKESGEALKSSKNEIVLSRSLAEAKQLKTSVFQPLVTYSQVNDNNYQYSLNSKGFKLRSV